MNDISIPAYRRRSGGLEVIVWEDHLQDGTRFFTISLDRSFHVDQLTGEQLERIVTRYSTANCHAAIQILSEALDWVMQQTTTAAEAA